MSAAALTEYIRQLSELRDNAPEVHAPSGDALVGAAQQSLDQALILFRVALKNEQAHEAVQQEARG